MLKILFDHMHGWARVSFFLAPLAIMGEALLDLQQPTLMASIVDVGLAKKDMTYVWHTAILMAVIAIAAFALGAICNAFSSYAALKMGQNLRTRPLAYAAIWRHCYVDYCVAAAVMDHFDCLAYSCHLHLRHRAPVAATLHGDARTS